MKYTKHVLTPFTFYDRSGIQTMLEKQAKKGWLLEKIGPFFWKYRCIEPKKLHFAVTYLPKVSQFDPTPNLAEEFYQDFVSQSGWQFAASTGQIQIFYHEGENPVPIETDALLEIDNIHRAVKKSYLPSYFMMLAVALLNLSTRIPAFLKNPVDVLADNMSLFALLVMVLLFVAEVWEIIGYFLWRHRAIQRAKLDGTFLETRGKGRASALTLIALVLLIVMIFLASDKRMIGPMLFYLAGLLVMIGILSWLLRRMKENGVHRTDSKIAMVIGAVMGALILISLFSAWLFQSMDDTQRETPSEEYYYKNVCYNRYLEPVPLGIPELTGEDETLFSSRSSRESSFLLDRISANTVAIKTVEDGKSMRYEVLVLKLPFLEGLCIRDWMNDYQDPQAVEIFGEDWYGEYRDTDPTPWGAQRAYQLYQENAFQTEYILCFDGILIHLTLNWEPTAQQMALVGSALTNEQNFENIENN